jgi:hypothetical protein
MKMGNTAEELYQERKRRIEDVVQLKKPDRVPIMFVDNGWALKYAGVSWANAQYDFPLALEAEKKAALELNWDAFFFPAVMLLPGEIYDMLEVVQLKWAGAKKEENRLKVNSTYQFVEPGSLGRYDAMPPEDYDWFIDDPTDYFIRGHWPKIMKVLEPLKELMPLIHEIGGLYGGGIFLMNLGRPDILKALRTMIDAAEKAFAWTSLFPPFVMEMKQLGVPLSAGAMTFSPYDYLADFLRGTEGCMIDMFRRPDKLKEAIKKVTPYCINLGLSTARQWKDLSRTVFIPVHKGAGGFMSNEQFEEFWWPSMREVMMALIDEDFIPWFYTEGIYTDRLPIIKDIPKGKAIYHIESDIFKAKEILGDTVCLEGGPSGAMLNTGSPEQVKEYCKKLIDVIGEGGGFIMGTELPMITARIENVRAMTEAVVEYGVY